MILAFMGPTESEQVQTAVQDRPGVITFPPLIYASALLVGLAMQIVLPMGLAASLWLKILGGALLGIALSLITWAERTMTQAGTNVNPMKPALALVTAGPFRFTRNPMYLSLTLLYVGMALLLNALWPMLLLPAVLIIMQYGVILREESYLERKFGNAYTQYKSQVRRWL